MGIIKKINDNIAAEQSKPKKVAKIIAAVLGGVLFVEFALPVLLFVGFFAALADSSDDDFWFWMWLGK